VFRELNCGGSSNSCPGELESGYSTSSGCGTDREHANSRAAVDISEIGLNVVLSTAQPRFEGGYEGIAADLYEAGCPGTLLMGDGGSTRDKRFLWHAIEVPGSALDVSTGLVEFVPADFRESVR